ncbi:MAG TPA: N-6 DNA methylase [Blastocatellia bacterium]|nr:N-6 DNA methylase [Blastocatellia bacterium]
MGAHIHNLPCASPARELLRQKGQFWTPEWVAEAMAAYVLAGDSHEVFDPAVGAGALLRATRAIASLLGKKITLSGAEIDPDALHQARRSGLPEDDLTNVQIRDFVLNPPEARLQAVIANPPYIRHHRLSSDVKARLKKYGASLIGNSLDGRAGLHVYFLLRALDLLDRNGRLAFIMPADTCEGVFAHNLWRWITQRYRLETVITFSDESSPFQGVDTNPVVFLIRNIEPVERFLWVKCHKANTDDLRDWILSGFEKATGDALSVYRRELQEGLNTGLSRPPVKAQFTGPVLSDYAVVMRGIATGANEFFFLTRRQADALKIPDEFLLPAIGRTRDLTGDTVTCETIRMLEESGRPTLLFSPDGRPLEGFPQAVRDYLRQGEMTGIHTRTLIATRRPWYKMEVRKAPPILFAYLGRRNARFIRNFAEVMPLTGFLCVYPRRSDGAFLDKLWEILRHPETVANLTLVGKSYGSGAIKVEPRALEALPLPVSVVSGAGLQPIMKDTQMMLGYS